MKSISLETPPKNIKIAINDKKNVKCINIKNKTWVHVGDFSDMSKQEVIPFLDNNPEIKNHCMQFNYWGTKDYYVDAVEGLPLLNNKLNEKKLWY